MCSSTLGPAIEPSLFTWPMTKTVIPSPFASCISAMVHSLTWLMLPGAAVTSPWYRVWMESTTSTPGWTVWTASTTFSKLVSERRWSPSPLTRSRSARSLIWRSDSSPDTYSTVADRHSWSQIWSIRVDFPIPGAPPTSTSEPRTAPPPRTRSSSPIPVGKRSSSVVSTSAIVLGRLTATPRALPRLAAGLFLAAFSAGRSTMVFHAPQAGHFPCHFGVSLPHSVQ